jgi:hypothetical protein
MRIPLARHEKHAPNPEVVYTHSVSRLLGYGLLRAEGLPLWPADKFHSKTNPPAFLTAATYRAKIRRFGDDKEMAFDVMVAGYGEPDVAALNMTGAGFPAY